MKVSDCLNSTWHIYFVCLFQSCVLCSFVSRAVVVVGFVNATLNISETEGRGEVCIAPMSVPAAGFSVPINVSVDVVYIDPAMCSGSGNASSKC